MDLNGEEIFISVFPNNQDFKDKKWHLFLCLDGVWDPLWHMGKIQGSTEKVSASWITYLVTSIDLLHKTESNHQADDKRSCWSNSEYEDAQSTHGIVWEDGHE